MPSTRTKRQNAGNIGAVIYGMMHLKDVLMQFYMIGSRQYSIGYSHACQDPDEPLIY